jgi:hypothetical protein
MKRFQLAEGMLDYYHVAYFAGPAPGQFFTMPATNSTVPEIPHEKAEAAGDSWQN